MTQPAQHLASRLTHLSEKVREWKTAGLSEYDTRRVLIEPLLQALGWDVHDPGVVRAELSTAGGRVDYALLVDRRPAVFIEAKSLNSSLPVKDAAQLVGYGATEGVRWGVLTDGADYKLYDCFNTGDLEEKHVFTISLERLPDDANRDEWALITDRLMFLQKGCLEPDKAADRNLIALKVTRTGFEESGESNTAPTPPTSEEADVWKMVDTSFIHLRPLYLQLRSRIADRMPELVAEIESGGKGWIKFRNAPTGRYAKFGLCLKARGARIEVWFKSDDAAPDAKVVERKGMESRMGRGSGKGFFITNQAQVDDDVLDWLVAATPGALATFGGERRTVGQDVVQRPSKPLEGSERLPANGRSSVNEQDVWEMVEQSYSHLSPLYRELRSRIAARMPQLVAERESGGNGWIKFRDDSSGRYAKFGLCLKARRDQIEIWFKSNRVAPDPEAVARKPVESRMHRNSGKGFFVSSEEDLDDEVMGWLEAAS